MLGAFRDPPRSRDVTDPRRLIPGLAFAAGLTLAPAAASHPHIFIDGGVDFLFDAEGRIESVRVTWIYDPLTSLFMFEDLGIGADDAGPLTEPDRARLAAYQTDWYPEFEGDSYLWDGARRVALSRPLAPDAERRAGRAVIRFLRRVEPPFRPGAETVMKIYDPTYYTAYAVTDPPRLEGAAGGCRAEVVPFEPTGPLAALQQELGAIPADQDPEEEVGALFAERVFVACD
jgi:ABC-type uncharacterized transport system substrate-binding protein